MMRISERERGASGAPRPWDRNGDPPGPEPGAEPGAELALVLGPALMLVLVPVLAPLLVLTLIELKDDLAIPPAPAPEPGRIEWDWDRDMLDVGTVDASEAVVERGEEGPTVPAPTPAPADVIVDPVAEVEVDMPPVIADPAPEAGPAGGATLPGPGKPDGAEPDPGESCPAGAAGEPGNWNWNCIA